jgi:putative copper export protein/mono/diheme cytochrome c family protein
MTTQDILVPALRGTHVVSLISAFGTLLFALVIAERSAIHLRRVLYRLARISAVCALLTGVAWMAVETAVIADATNFSSFIDAVPIVALRTQYGRWFLFRCALLIILPWLPLGTRFAGVMAVALAASALAVQPWLGHAGAMGGSLGTELISSETLHLLAAGAWLGGLLPLLIAIGRLPHQAAALACRRFTPIGLSAVLLLAGTAIAQVAALMGGLPGLFGTSYGHIALVKLGLFIVLLALAALNRLVLTDRLARSASFAARRWMHTSIVIEMTLGLAVIVTAGFLASSAPGMHEQPVWPFAWRPSLAALRDPSLRSELILALTATGIGACIAITALPWRRWRWQALGLGLAILVVAVPHLKLLLTDAYPTTFFASPTDFAASAIVHGAKLFAANCVVCHGEEGQGDGPAAKSLLVQPLDLTAAHLWAHTDGDLYWYVSRGFASPNGSTEMPGFGNTLPSDEIWELIDYLHAQNAGHSMRLTGKWLHPLQVPQFDAVCPSDRTLSFDDLRGRLLRIEARSGSEREDAPPQVDATTVLLVRNHASRPIEAACVAVEPEAWSAFAIILGQKPDTLAGWQILVDKGSWLRAAWHPGDPGDWNDPQALEDIIRDISAHPLAITPPSGHVHTQ